VGKAGLGNRCRYRYVTQLSWAVFRTTLGPHRDGCDNARKIGRDWTASPGPGQVKLFGGLPN